MISLTHWFFQNVLFNFNFFKVILLLLISSSFQCIQRTQFTWFQYFKIHWLVSWLTYIFCSGLCPMPTWEECIFHCCWVKYYINVCQVQLVYSVLQVLYFLITFLFHVLLKVWYWIYNHYYGTVCFPTSILPMFASYFVWWLY